MLLEELRIDIAVETKNGTETKGRLAILAGALGVGAEGKSTNESSTINRIKFSVPISFSRLTPSCQRELRTKISRANKKD